MWVGSKSTDQCCSKRGRGGFETEGEGEIGVIEPQARVCLEPPEAGRGREGFTLRVSGGNLALLTL